MTTQDLIALLANNAAAVKPNATARRYGLALGWGASGATLMMLVWLGVRADIAEAALLPMFWIKLSFVASISASGLIAAARLSQPGVRIGLAPAVLAAPMLVVWSMAMWMLLTAGASERADLVLGRTWDQAPFIISVLSTPALAAAFWAMRGLAPTRPALSGAAAGMLAGGIGAIAYSFHCTEMAAPFVGIWHLAGVLLPVAVGAALGPILLRW
jgi:hypothetical protein